MSAVLRSFKPCLSPAQVSTSELSHATRISAAGTYTTTEVSALADPEGMREMASCISISLGDLRTTTSAWMVSVFYAIYRAASKEATEYPAVHFAPLLGCVLKKWVMRVQLCALEEEMKWRPFAFPQPKCSDSTFVGDRAAAFWSSPVSWVAKLLLCLCALLGDWTSNWGLRVPPGPARGHFLCIVQRGKARLGYETQKVMCCFLFYKASGGLSR